ncbi:unnamed protein product [Ilex paraguariensis]|uniref:Dirigent protein n=1 Tax=Ilex paraguariensis TaxID=185542 RepID=A0ABC8RZP6_9AQUA
MAKTLYKMSSIIFIMFFFSLLLLGNSHTFSRNLSKESLDLKEEKLAHLHFYFHDVVTGPNATAYRVAQATITNTSATGFGAVVVLDNALTEGPNLSSKLVGRAQGIYALAALNESSLLMVLNFEFIEGVYNGSTLTILGRNPVFSPVREMPIVGGIGVFRFSRGYVQAKTFFFDMKTGYTVVEYNVYVLHY